MKGPKAEKIQQLFDSIAKDYDKLNHILSLGVDRSWRKRALKWIIDGNEDKSVLDLACGTGDFSLEIARHSGDGTRVCGLDLSEGMLEVMRRKVSQAGLSGRISVEQGNCEAMRYADASFDRATIAFGIRNFENRELSLKEILRVLKPGAIFHLSTDYDPYFQNWLQIFQNLQELYEPAPQGIQDMADVKTDFELHWNAQGKEVRHVCYRVRG